MDETAIRERLAAARKERDQLLINLGACSGQITLCEELLQPAPAAPAAPPEEPCLT